jgi:SPP1 gp7 family putative phage head morphogenesis protein
MKDPTKTLVIRNRASKEINKRFNKIKTFVRDSIFIGNLITNATQKFSLIRPRQYEFLRDSSKIAEFNRFLQLEIDREILGIADGTIEPKNYWLNVHVGQGYERGAKKTRLIAERGIKSLVGIPDYSPLLNPAHIERAEFIYTRVFNDMKNVTDTMRGQMSRVLADGMLQGLNPKDVARNMLDRVDKIGMTRARLIARTEIVESHNQASIKEAELLEKETGVPIKMQWITSLDGRERETHRQRHLLIYTADDALRLIGEPNCRCSVSAYIDIKKL